MSTRAKADGGDTSGQVTCDETGQVFTEPKAAYKHALHVFHLPALSTAELIRMLESHENAEYARRATKLLTFAQKGGI